jgi:hypothetical protein
MTIFAAAVPLRTRQWHFGGSLGTEVDSRKPEFWLNYNDLTATSRLNDGWGRGNYPERKPYFILFSGW